MTRYTVTVTAEIVYEDAEVTDEQPEDDDEPCLPDGTPIYKSRALTRQERLQGLADQGIDTWANARGER